MKANLHTVWLVALRELRTRVRSRSFVIGTLITILMVAAYPLMMFLISRADSPTSVGFAPTTAAVAAPLKSAADANNTDIRTERVTDVATGERRVREGELDALVTSGRDGVRLVVEKNPDEDLTTALNQVLRQRAMSAELARAGLDPTALRQRVASSTVTVDSLEPPDPQTGQRLILAFSAGFLLYMFLIGSGQMIAQGVVEEKSSRVVEILLSSIRPSQLLGGKILGIGLTGLLQFGIIGVIGGAVAAMTDAITLPTATVGGLLAWLVVWFVLGFLFYATIMAAGASLVSRQEDLQGVVTPVIMALIVPFVAGVSLLPGDPDNPLGSVLSIIPGFSPVLMPMRIALGSATTWQTLLASALSVLATFALLWVGARVYANAVLRTGARVKLSEAIRTG